MKKSKGKNDDMNSVLTNELIKVQISRALCDHGKKAFILTCSTHNIKRANNKFGTLIQLKSYYGFDTMKKTKNKDWAISSRGKRHEWFIYEAYISSEYVI